MYQFTLVSSVLVSLTIGLANSTPLYGEIESDLDTTRQSISKANQILASINRDVDLCLTNAVACSLKSYDDLDYQTLDGSQSASGYSGNIDSSNYTDVDQTNNETSVTLPPSTASPVSVPMYGPVPPIKIVVPPSSDQKFTHVLEDLDSLEVHVSSAIANFTSSRRFTYTAMLKPMLKHIHQLKNNLSLLQNRLIGVAALTNIASQVNELTDHISDALVSGSDVPLDDTPADGSTTKPNPSTSSSTTTTTVKAVSILPSTTPVSIPPSSSPVSSTFSSPLSSKPSESTVTSSTSTESSPSQSNSSSPLSSSPSTPSSIATTAAIEISETTSNNPIVVEDKVDEVNTISSY
ncbi:putative GPI-anchored protein pfl2 [Tetranychus urticae]|uniref:Uncharacterized protein n=1 Tax=Tetranychus urticae TaxID=32264 RepID=T1KIC5_TETUR|nr:putative GPI-anchored protein pfl2 [Tetranychus urticae]